MLRKLIPFLLLSTIGCATSATVPDGTAVSNTIQTTQEAETRAQYEVLHTECDDNWVVDLDYHEVIIISATHWTGSERVFVDGWAPTEDGRMTIVGCAEQVEIVYMWRTQ